MASTELSLKRTLTDILEDELYHLNNKNNGVSYHYPISNKAYMANPNPNHSNNNNNNNSLPINNNSNNNSTNVDETVITIEPEKLNLIPENENYYISNNNLYNKKETNISNYQLQQQQQQQQQNTTSLTMFNKYADPSLTTTSILPPTNKLSIQYNGPVVATINMEKLLKSTNNNSNNNNPYNKNNSYTISRDNLDVKVSNDIETQEINDSYIFFDDNEQQFIPKVHYSLEDNHMSLNNEDAKLIFDDEFSDDDDFDDDSREYDIDDDEIISSLAIENSKNIATKTNNLYSFVDSTNDNLSTTVIPNSNSTIATGNVELDEDTLLDGDDFYEKNSLGKIVVTDEEIKELNRSKSLSLTTRPIMIRNSNNNNNNNMVNGNGNKLRKPLTNINSNTNNDDSHNNHIKKHKTYLGSDLSGSNTNEIFTCRLVNLITKEPCAAQFSRSYDLTRHQNTIHAKKKIVFRCSECMKLLGNEGYEKTFSRLDALTRHIKSKHENLTPEERQRVTKYAKENIGYATA